MTALKAAERRSYVGPAYRERSAQWSYDWYRLLASRHFNGSCLRCRNGAYCNVYAYCCDNADAAGWRLANEKRQASTAQHGREG